MIETIKRILGMGAEVDYSQLVKEGAIILDVRTKGEYAGGHIKGSLNISVDHLTKSFNKLPDKQKAIITCCASGMRSSSAKHILASHGYTKVYNGGSWGTLQSKI